jgi:hypothetical protein
MKAPRWDDVLFGSERAYRRPLTPRVSDESLFSFLARDGRPIALGEE